MLPTAARRSFGVPANLTVGDAFPLPEELPGLFTPLVKSQTMGWYNKSRTASERTDRGAASESRDGSRAVARRRDERGGTRIRRRTALGLFGAVSLSGVGAGVTAASSGRDDEHAEPSECVETLTPEGAIETTGTWNLGTRAGDVVYVAGMRGIDPETNELVEGARNRVRQGFENMRFVAESAGATLDDAARIVVYVTDMYRYRPLVNEDQAELWGDDPYPPRTIVEVDRLNQDDIFEVEGTFYAPNGEPVSK
jgi:enamine deaminase RidA (YjgF/YER057c/UK114 family)